MLEHNLRPIINEFEYPYFAHTNLKYARNRISIKTEQSFKSAILQ